MPDASYPDVVRAVFAEDRSRPLTAGEILIKAQLRRSEITAVQVNSAIYRLKEAGELRAEGTKGSMKYRWAGTP
jgi:hypothetical protein